MHEHASLLLEKHIFLFKIELNRQYPAIKSRLPKLATKINCAHDVLYSLDCKILLRCPVVFSTAAKFNFGGLCASCTETGFTRLVARDLSGLKAWIFPAKLQFCVVRSIYSRLDWKVSFTKPVLYTPSLIRRL